MSRFSAHTVQCSYGGVMGQKLQFSVKMLQQRDSERKRETLLSVKLKCVQTKRD